MENEFIPYEQALDLKELRFDESCLASYVKETKEFTTRSFADFYKDQQVLAPLYQQAFRWFREKHDLFGQVNIHTYFIYDISNDGFKMIKQYDKLTNTYEEAELECLIKLIEIVKNK
jgi:hypothetical protein